MTTPKYDKDSPFEDPVLRCDSCNKIVLMETLRTLGTCKCGNRKVRSLMTFTKEEHDQMIEWEVDPEFLARFKEAPDVR